MNLEPPKNMRLFRARLRKLDAICFPLAAQPFKVRKLGRRSMAKLRENVIHLTRIKT